MTHQSNFSSREVWDVWVNGKLIAVNASNVKFKVAAFLKKFNWCYHFIMELSCRGKQRRKNIWQKSIHERNWVLIENVMWLVILSFFVFFSCRNGFVLGQKICRQVLHKIKHVLIPLVSLCNQILNEWMETTIMEMEIFNGEKVDE